MRLMSYVKVRPKTGLYEYRRVVPPELRAHLPPVPGFTLKPGRTEFTKALGVGAKREAEANRRAAEIDRVVEAALRHAAEAARRQSPPIQKGNTAAPPPEAVRPPVSPQQAFAALDRWLERSIRQEEVRVFNNPGQHLTGWHGDDTLNEAAKHLSYGRYEQIPDFDERLVAALTSEGIQISVGHPALGRLRHGFCRRWLALLNAEGQMHTSGYDWSGMTGDVPAIKAVEVPVSPTNANSSVSSVSLDKLMSDYAAEAPRSPGTLVRLEAATRYLKELVPDANDVSTITVDHVLTLRDLALKRPARLKRAELRLPLAEVVRRAESDTSRPSLDRKTVSLWLDLLSAAFELWARRGRGRENPVLGAKFSTTRRRPKAKPRTSFTPEEIKAFFASPLFTGCSDVGTRRAPGNVTVHDERFWIPLLAYYTGCRLNEIGQARLADVRSDVAHGIAFLDITVEEDDAEVASKTLKTAQSRRKMPLHPALLDLGFMNYVETVKASGAVHLFPKLPHRRGEHPTRALSKWLNRYLDHVGIKDKRKTFHSFRHTFKEACDNAGLTKVISDRLTGHASSDASGMYGEGPSLSTLYEALKKLPLLTLSGVIPQSDASHQR
jgi:integrase